MASFMGRATHQGNWRTKSAGRNGIQPVAVYYQKILYLLVGIFTADRNAYRILFYARMAAKLPVSY